MSLNKYRSYNDSLLEMLINNVLLFKDMTISETVFTFIFFQVKNVIFPNNLSDIYMNLQSMLGDFMKN